MSSQLNARLDQLAEAWNEAEIARPSLGRWIEQFAEAMKKFGIGIEWVARHHDDARVDGPAVSIRERRGRRLVQQALTAQPGLLRRWRQRRELGFDRAGKLGRHFDWQEWKGCRDQGHP